VRPGSEALADALAWLEKAPEPFFLWIHLFDAHSPPREKNRKYLKELAADDALRDYMSALHMNADHPERPRRERRRPRRARAAGGGPTCSCSTTPASASWTTT
jgi:hypothetical protein